MHQFISQPTNQPTNQPTKCFRELEGGSLIAGQPTGYSRHLSSASSPQLQQHPFQQQQQQQQQQYQQQQQQQQQQPQQQPGTVE